MPRASDAAKSDRRWLRARVAVAVLCVLSVTLPLLYVLRIALERLPAARVDAQLTVPTHIGPSAGFTFQNFTDAWSSGGLSDAFLTSLEVVPLGAAIATLLATLAGFAFAKLPVPGRRTLAVVFACGLAVPGPVIAVPLISQGVRLGYINSTLGLAICYGAIFSIFGTLYMAAYFTDLPDSLLESAALDGCNPMQSFRWIVMPLAVPAIAAVFVLNILLQWAELLLALVLLPKRHTASVAVATFQNAYATGGPSLAAASILSALPVVVVVVACQRFLRSGMHAGAVKA